MTPGIHVVERPACLNVYARGTQGTGAIPAPSATFLIPLWKGDAAGVEDILRQPDATIVPNQINTGTHAPKRYAGLYTIDLMLFQDGPAQIELYERPPNRVTQGTAGQEGVSDTTRLIKILQVRANITFRQTWRGIAAEQRIRYRNGAGTLTIFALDVELRAD